MKKLSHNNINELDFTNAKDLKLLIEQTYVIEEQYKSLKQSYDALSSTLAQIIEVLPSAIWILDEDKSVFLQNKLATQNITLYQSIDLSLPYQEAQIDGRHYQVKTISHLQKTIISATDITEEKRTERLASMGQVSAHLAHEIRNPIGSISLLLSTLYGRTELKNKPLVMQMQEALRRVERIIRHTLLFTKGISLERTKFDISELGGELQEIFDGYSDGDIALELDLRSGMIDADRQLLVLVLGNLIYNAIDAINELRDMADECGDIAGSAGGAGSADGAVANVGSADNAGSAAQDDFVVRIISRKKSDKTIITITDNGVPIQISDAFEAYKTTKLKGNGLGLSLSREIINAHNGQITLIKSPKQFIITL